MAAREALADATAGVVGSLTSMVVFYPIDVIKTNLQADKSNQLEQPNTAEKSNPTNPTRVTADDTHIDTRDTQHLPGRKKQFPSSSTDSKSTVPQDNIIINSLCRDERKRIHDGKIKNELQIKSTSQQPLSILRHILRKYFRGIHYKTAHTIVSSFVYFYISSYISSLHQRRWRRSQQRIGQQESSRTTATYQPSTVTRLALSAVAAMLNVTVTLPFDVLAARSQTESAQRSSAHCQQARVPIDAKIDNEAMPNDEKNDVFDSSNNDTNDTPNAQTTETIMQDVWDDIETNSSDLTGTDDNESQDGYNTASEDEDVSVTDDPQCVHQSGDSVNTTTVGVKVKESIALTSSSPSLSSYWPIRAEMWSGLWPSLLLCSNPSIHFTVFDILKDSLLKYKAIQKSQSLHGQSPSSTSQRLHMMEAFLLGLIAKFSATMATYPLIRAKVLLMVANKRKQRRSISNRERTDSQEFTTDDDVRVTMIGLLKDMFRQDGVPGLYKGCRLQLLHTLLKSALLMMIRERITIITRKMLLGSST